MIKPNELRLGNYVAVKNHGEEVIGKVFAINENLISVDGGNNNYDYHLLEPIPLSEEILLKCGFENFGYGIFDIPLNNSCDKSFSIQDGFCFLAGENSDCVFNTKKVEHLHQLQNLYFAITGKELEVNL